MVLPINAYKDGYNSLLMYPQDTIRMDSSILMYPRVLKSSDRFVFSTRQACRDFNKMKLVLYV